MSKFTVLASWDDVPHLTAEQKKELAASIPPYQLDARSKGIPQLGSGAIFPVPESDIKITPFELPAWYERCYALDVGWNRTAALWAARDPETDIVYVYSEYYRSHAEPPVHAAAIRSRGDWIPGVIDPAARGRAQKDGEQLTQAYRDLGLDTLSDADHSVESGIYETWIRLTTGRLKVFDVLVSFWREYRLYRRDDKGHIVKENDHLMDCLRYVVMSGVKKAAPLPTRLFAQMRATRQVETYNPMAEMFKLR